MRQGASFFEAMFRGGFQESQTNVVPLVDVQAPVFKVISIEFFQIPFNFNILLQFRLGNTTSYLRVWLLMQYHTQH